MNDVYFNKNAQTPKNSGNGNKKRPQPKTNDQFEDISSNSHGKPETISKGGKPAKVKGPKSKKKTAAKTILIILIVILLIIAIIFAYGFNLLGKFNYTPGEHKDNQYISDTDLYSSEDVTNILLLGVDAREGETDSRSDTMMLISIDKAHKKIKLTSFLRDSYVEIPGSGWNKLNASCMKGGTQLVIDTLEYNYKIKIDNYMKVDFEAFEKLIDSVGGVNVEVTEKEANYLNKTWGMWSLTGNPLTFTAGESTLNGEEALMYCRIRKLDSDFMRTERQRKTITSLKTKVMGQSPTKLMGIANDILPLIETDIKQNDMMKLCMGAVFSYLKYDTAQMAIPVDGTWHSESKKCGDSLVFDIGENTKLLKDFIYNDIYEGKEAESTTAAK